MVRRLLSSVLILAIVSAVTFFLFFAVPGDPARLSCGKICTPAKLAEIHKNLGLDQPLLVAVRQLHEGDRRRPRRDRGR